MDARDILTRAQERIRGHWYQGYYSDDSSNNDGSNVCMMGAINWAATGKPQMDHMGFAVKMERIKAIAALEEVIGDSVVARWNDQKGRTEEEVLEAFDKAKALL